MEFVAIVLVDRWHLHIRKITYTHARTHTYTHSATIATAPNVVGKVRPETRRYFGSELQTHCRDHAGLVLTSPFDKVC